MSLELFMSRSESAKAWFLVAGSYLLVAKHAAVLRDNDRAAVEDCAHRSQGKSNSSPS